MPNVSTGNRLYSSFLVLFVETPRKFITAFIYLLLNLLFINLLLLFIYYYLFITFFSYFLRGYFLCFIAMQKYKELSSFLFSRPEHLINY
jgi:hypothetical protein